MIVFFSGGTSVPWQISIGLLILSSIFSTPFFGGGLVSFFQLDSYQPINTRAYEDEDESLGWMAIVCLGIAGCCGYLLCLFLLQVSRHAQAHGLRHTLRKLWQTPIRRWHTFLRPQGRHNPLARQQPTPSHEERFAKVSDLIAKLPIESYISREGLQALSPHDLKAHLKRMGMDFKPGEVIDRNEAIQIALQKAGSSGESCTVCCEDYTAGDLMRRLPKCRHCFHLECIDRWLLSTAEYSNRVPSCPVCNTAL